MEKLNFWWNHKITARPFPYQPEIPPLSVAMSWLSLWDQRWYLGALQVGTKQWKIKNKEINFVKHHRGNSSSKPYPCVSWECQFWNTCWGIQTQFIQLLSCLSTRVLSLHKKEELLPPIFYCPSLECGEPIKLVSHCFCYSPFWCTPSNCCTKGPFSIQHCTPKVKHLWAGY